MPTPTQGQSTAKTAFLLSSAVGWLIVGASLIYIVPFALNLFRPSELTSTWIATLSRSGYDPMLAINGGGTALVITTLGNWIWYQKFEGKV